MQKFSEQVRTEFEDLFQKQFPDASLNNSGQQFLHDFYEFMHYLEDHQKIKVSKTNHGLPLKSILEIEAKFHTLFNSTLSSKQCYHLEIHFFMLISQILAICAIDEKNYLHVTSHYSEFQQFPPHKQFSYMIYSFWFQLKWGDLMPPTHFNHSDAIQNLAGEIMELLSFAKVGNSSNYSSFIKTQQGLLFEMLNKRQMEELLAHKSEKEYTCQTLIPIFEHNWHFNAIWVQKMIPLFNYIGLICATFSFADTPIETAKEPIQIQKIEITQMGHEIFSILNQIEKILFQETEENFIDSDDGEIDDGEIDDGEMDNGEMDNGEMDEKEK